MVPCEEVSLSSRSSASGGREAVRVGGVESRIGGDNFLNKDITPDELH